MTFPRHLAEVLDRFRIRPDTKATLYDFYLQYGADALDSFSSLSEDFDAASQITPEDLAGLRTRMVEAYLRKNHELWLQGKPTPSLYAPRAAEGRASGLVMPLGNLDVVPDEGSLLSEIKRSIDSILAPGQVAPSGLVLFSKNAHFGGRAETISFDVVSSDLDDALLVAGAEGRQHTVPGSIGETSGTLDAAEKLALIWEIQPNVLKPFGERNQTIAKIHRRNRNWHLLTLAAAIRWLQARGIDILILNGSALTATHEVNPHQPVPEAVIVLHDRTVETVAAGLGNELVAVSTDDQERLIGTELMNTGLRKLVSERGARHAMRRLRYERRIE